MRPNDDGHEWLSFLDEDGTQWLFDTTFLLSNFQCIYGSGCESIATEPAPNAEVLGCCTHGAHMADTEDRKSVKKSASRLTAEDWQFIDIAKSKGGPLKKKDGAWVTRKVDGACIFLNRKDFNGGGCALHIGAERVGERPLDWKPDVCWQVPIRLDVHEDDYGNETVFIKAWERKDWGPGGDDFHWWCIDEEKPYAGETPVYVSSKEELVELCGQELYDRVVVALKQRTSGNPVNVSITPTT